MYKKEFMNLAVDKARETMNSGHGGPFGATITKKGKVIVVSSNKVLLNNDPTAHAEISAIREACQILGTYDLSGCEIYATGYPCPMCVSAIIWANIKKVYYGCSPQDADKIGFRDDFIYEFIQQGLSNEKVLNIEQAEKENCLSLFEEYHKNSNTIY